MKVKKILAIMGSLIFIQLIRILFKKFIFLFIDRTLLTDMIVNIVFLLLIISIFMVMMKKKSYSINVFPEKFNTKYKILTILLLIFFFITPIITNNYEVFNILSLIYNAILAVIFEEIIFRGFVWKELSNIKGEKFAYIFSSILFGLWHLGYIDTIIWRTSLFFPNSNIINIMFWKVITGMVLGIIFGFFRYKNKNIYSSMLVHTLINIIGS